MILADKIILLRKKAGWSQEELAEQLDVSRQSVSKWEGGLSVPDLNKIIAMSALFGVSTDYLLKDSLEDITPSETADTDDETEVRTISTEDVNHYLAGVQSVSWRIALGVMLCILSPITLIVLGGYADSNGAISEGIAGCVGLLVLFLLVGGAIGLFVPAGLSLSRFDFLDKEVFHLGYGVRGIVEKKRSEFRPRFVTCLTVAILFCIFSVIPLVVMGSLGAGDIPLVWCLAFLFVVCAFAVGLIVRISFPWGAFGRLLQEGEFSRDVKKAKKRNEAADGAYWSVMLAIYLLVSFLTSAWHITWVVWPISGCLYPVFLLIVNAIRKP